MKLEIKKIDGSATGEKVSLKKDVFEIEPNNHCVYLAVKAERANGRQGTASTKNRGEVKGSGVKLYRQKGTGRARVGDINTPTRPGGGRAFGPKPRDYSMKMNRKAKSLARKSMLSVMLKNERIIVVDSLEIKTNKTKQMAGVIASLELEGQKVLVAASSPTENLWLSSRNLHRLQVKVAADVSTYDLWSTDYLLIDRAGVDNLNNALSK